MKSRAIPESFRGRKAADVRMEGDAPKSIEGYGAVFYNASDPGTEYRLWDNYYARIMPVCVARAIREDDVRSMFNHDANQLLGRRQFNDSDTLRLSVDATGLRYEIDIDPDDPTHQNLIPKLRTGKVSGASFMFEVTRRSWLEEERGEGDNKRTVDVVQIEEVRLWEVGPVVFPAYESATSEARSLERQAIDQERSERRGKSERERFRLRLQLQMDAAGLK